MSSAIVPGLDWTVLLCMKSGGKCLGILNLLFLIKRFFTIYSDASDACIFPSCELLNFFSLLLLCNLYLHGCLYIQDLIILEL
jgi:hypothetical protein